MKLWHVTKDDEWIFADYRPSILAFDTETLDSNFRFKQEGWVTHLSWCIDPDMGCVAAIDDVPPTVLKWLEDRSIIKVAHNAAFDIKAVSVALGIRVEPCHDTMVLIHLADPASKSVVPRGLKPWGRQIGMPYWNAPLQRWQEEALYSEDPKKKWPVQSAPWPHPEEILLPYSAADSVATYRLYLHLMGVLDRLSKGTGERFKKLLTMYSKAIPAMAHMELNGIAMDALLLERIAAEAGQKMKTEEGTVHWILEGKLGDPKDPRWTEKFIRSPKQMSEWFAWKNVVLPTTKKDNPSTNDKALEGIKKIAVRPQPWEMAQAILAYRKAKGRQDKARYYLDRLVDGVLPTGFDLAGARSGRSSSSPQSQNPDREGLLRSCFITRWR